MAEQVLLLENIGTSLKVGPQQLGSLHKLLIEACKILQMTPPDLYIRQVPLPASCITSVCTGELRNRVMLDIVFSDSLSISNITDSIHQTVAAFKHSSYRLYCTYGLIKICFITCYLELPLCRAWFQAIAPPMSAFSSFHGSLIISAQQMQWHDSYCFPSYFLQIKKGSWCSDKRHGCLTARISSAS